MSSLIPQFKYDHKSLSLISNDISNNSINEVNHTNSNNTNINNNSPYTINPELVNYISRVQNDQERYKRLSTLGEISEKRNNNASNINGNDSIDEKTKARRGLLYILNSISEDAFCPEINLYFSDLKDMKKNEQQNSPSDSGKNKKDTSTLNNTLKDNLSIKNPLTRMKTLKNQLLMNNNKNNKSVNNGNNVMSNSTGFTYNFKKRTEKPAHVEKESVLGIKSFKKDYKLRDLENVYSLDEIESGVMRFQLSKEAKAKMNLLQGDNNKETSNLLESKKKKKKSRFTSTSLIMKKDNSELLPLNPKNKKERLKEIKTIAEADNSSSSY